MKRYVTWIGIFMFMFHFSGKADEGMWIPMLLDKFNIEIMQEKGFKLTAEDIYSINKACMKDAIVTMNHGSCTAEIISDQGLMITNHHCGLNYIQNHSSEEKDYLREGFWAMSKVDELPNPGLTVTFLVRMEDVTSKVLEGVHEEMDENERENHVQSAIAGIINTATEEGKYLAYVEPFYYGNQYFLFVTKDYYDVRLVGAPPYAIGNFGGDIDNWMWPRHTGDFSLFRIYADNDNNPSFYSPNNVPYIPKKHFSISLKPKKEGDFTMVFGYPGSTREYLTSHALEMWTYIRYPHRIKLRDKKLAILEATINTNAILRIQYTAKARGLSNSWKRWKGEILGLQKFEAVKKKKQLESDFQDWANASPERVNKYAGLLSEFEAKYTKLENIGLVEDYLNEVVFQNGIEIFRFASEFYPLVTAVRADISTDELGAQIENLKMRADKFFKDYDVSTDKKLFKTLLTMYRKNMPSPFVPQFLKDLPVGHVEEMEKFADKFYEKTNFVNREWVLHILNNLSSSAAKKMEKDPAFQYTSQFFAIYAGKVLPEVNMLEQQLNRLHRIYMAGLMEFQKDRVFYPDANSTMRVAYGNIQGYEPRDAVVYEWYTTTEGILEKDDPEVYDYNVPVKLRNLLKNKDFGMYAQDSTMHVCFAATNHTTGGNSGSPVIDAEGNLIGINFDRAWEGVMSDLMYHPEICRNISVDIGYVLFIIDKYAGAGYLLDEMTIIR